MSVAHMDHTPIGQNVVLLDPLTLEPLPVAMVDPHSLEPNHAHPPVLRDSWYRQGLADAREWGEIRNPLMALTDGFLIDGHHRRAIALELGLATVPVCFLSGAQARSAMATYSRDERRNIARHAHGRYMLERIARLTR
jgi:hypothetical protein